MNTDTRVFLFLQGPTGPFFRYLGRRLRSMGHKVVRVNLSGGDWWDWHGPEAVNFHKRYRHWPSWVAGLMRRERVTDLIVLADYRSRHMEAVAIAEFLKIRVYVLEEGYLRPWFITFEENGVNGNSSLPHTPEEYRRLAEALPEPAEPLALPDKSALLTRCTVEHLVGRFLFWPLFPFYKNYRPYSIFKEYIAGWIPRLLTKGKQRKHTEENFRRMKNSGMPYFLFPLQLDTDAQVRLFSPFTGMREAISDIMVSFARYAPKNVALVVKNHPLDCGIINYYRYVREYAKALGIGERVFFIEYGNNDELVDACLGVVLLNSTYGTMALLRGQAVYYVGQGICAMEGLGACEPQIRLQDFWNNPLRPRPEVLRDFVKVLRAKALINGDFLTPQGRELAIEGIISRLGLQQ